MSDFSIQMGNVRGEVDSLSDVVSRLNNSREDINQIISAITISGETGMMIKKSLKDVVDNLDDVKQRSDNMKSGLSNIINLYETAENTITGTETKSQLIIDVNGSTYNKKVFAGMVDDGEGGKNPLAFAKTSLAEGSILVSGSYGTLSADGKLLSAEASASAKTHFGDGDYSASIKANGSVSLAEGNISAEMKYAKISASGSLFSAMAETEAAAGLTFKNGIVSGELKASASAETAIAKVKGEGTLGTDKNNLYGKSEGSIVGAGAKSEAGISVKSNGTFSVKAEAGAEAYVAKGEVEGGASFLGIKFKASGEAMVGVEAKAGAEVKSTGVKVKVGIGPIGGTVAIDWSDFELPGFKGAASSVISDLFEQAHPYMHPTSESAGALRQA